MNKQSLQLYFRPIAQPFPEGLRAVKEVDGLTFLERLAAAERLADDPETTEAYVFPVSDEEAELVLLHRGIFPWEISLVTGLDGVSLWWANAASVYGSILFSELLEEDQRLARNDQRKQDIVRGSEIAKQLDPNGLAQETALRRQTRAQGARRKEEAPQPLLVGADREDETYDD